MNARVDTCIEVMLLWTYGHTATKVLYMNHSTRNISSDPFLDTGDSVSYQSHVLPIYISNYFVYSYA